MTTKVEGESMEAGDDAAGLRTFEQAKSTLYGTISAAGAALEKASRRRKSTVTSVASYLDRIQLDLSGLSVIHVTGTKGKGSTCAMVESVLRRHGFKTGEMVDTCQPCLYTSPHLLEVTERVRCNGKPLTKEAFARYFFQVWDRLQATSTGNTVANDVGDASTQAAAIPITTESTSEGSSSGDASKTRVVSAAHPTSTGGAAADEEPMVAEMPTYFHLLTLVGLWCFVQERVDVCVLEVGMGGRFDATNVLPSPVVCGVAMLDLDHTQILGDTLDKIAWEKGGIFKEGCRAMTVEQPRGGMSVLREVRDCRCAQKAGCPGGLEVVSPLTPCDPSGRAYELGLAGEHQRINAGLALSLCAAWMESQGQRQQNQEHDTRGEEGDTEAFLNSAEVHAGLSQCVWPGRCQVFRSPTFPSTTVYLDGAHTEQSMRACLGWFIDRTSEKQDARRPPPSGQRPQRGASRRRILWFNASHERDVVPLLDMLASARRRAQQGGASNNNHSSSTIGAISRGIVTREDGSGDGDGDTKSDGDDVPLFDEAWFMEVNPGRPSRFKPPTAEEILAPLGIHPSPVAPPAADAARLEGAADTAASSGRRAEEGGGAATGAWQRTLEQVWISLQKRRGVRLSTTLTGTAPHFLDRLARISAVVQEDGRSDAGGTIAGDHAESATGKGRDGQHEGEQVLCTGSLYAVSAALEAFGAGVV
ncbi:unnamed protein product [Scytosiphon promiscuus]